MRFGSKPATVTGGTSGIGHRSTDFFHRQDAMVIASDLDHTDGITISQVKAEISQLHNHV